MVVAARARNGGEFHSKVWLLRFGSEQRDEPTRMRLLVLSRNLTFDRCWDVSLCTGRDGERPRAGNQSPHIGVHHVR